MPSSVDSASQKTAQVTETPLVLRKLGGEFAEEPVQGANLIDTVVAIFKDAFPEMDATKLEAAVTTFLRTQHLTDYIMFCSYASCHQFPKKDTDASFPFWSVGGVRTLWKAIAKVISHGYEVTPQTPYRVVMTTYMAETEKGSSMATPNPGIPTVVTANNVPVKVDPAKIDFRTVAQLTFDKFDGDSSTYSRWREHVATMCGKYFCQSFLTDPKLCAENIPFSQSVLNSVRVALSDGNLRWLSDEYKNATDVSAFMTAIEKYSSKDLDKRNEIITSWCELFDLRLNDVVGFPTYQNKYKILVSKLKAMKSQAVGDVQFLRALIERGIQCEDLKPIKQLAARNPQWTADEYMDELNNSYIVIMADHKTTNDGTERKARNVSFKDSPNSDAYKLKSMFYSFPSAWKMKLGDALYNSLQEWRNMVITYQRTKSEATLKKIKNWIIPEPLATKKPRTSDKSNRHAGASRRSRRARADSTSDDQSADADDHDDNRAKKPAMQTKTTSRRSKKKQKSAGKVLLDKEDSDGYDS